MPRKGCELTVSRLSRQQDKGRRHLLDLDAPRQVVTNPVAEADSLLRVQRWVASTLAVTTIAHLSAAVVLAAVTLDDATRTSQIGLNVIAGVFGVCAVAAGRAIHGRSIISGWLALGLLPTAIGLWLTLR